MIKLRPRGDGDRAFLLRLFGTTRTRELNALPLSDAQKDGFLRSQFEIQDTQYRAQYPEADFSLVEVDGVQAGRLYVHRGSTEVTVVDISLLPEYRGQGHGTRLLRDLIAAADTACLPVTLHVQLDNPARSLYERLGFVALDEDGVYRAMRRPCEAS